MTKMFKVRLKFEGKELHKVEGDDPFVVGEELNVFLRRKFKK